MLPLFLLYEVSIVLANHGDVGVRVGADVWMKGVLVAIGAPGMLAAGVVVIAIGVLVYLKERRKNIPLRGRFFGGIILESIVYAVVVAVLVSTVVSLLMALIQDQTPVGRMPLLTRLSLSLGAGLYEELLFRVVLVGGLAAALSLASKRRETAYVFAALIGAVLFSAAHYIGAFGDAFTMSSFLFRFLFGLAMNAIFLLRGFGVAAWTHALYDVMIVTGMLG